MRKSISNGKKADKEIRKSFSEMSLSPSANATHAISNLFNKTPLGNTGMRGFDPQTIKDELQKQNEALKNGDVECIESMLLDQAHTLQALMTHNIIKLSSAEYLNQVETYSRLALKAQNQCRQTLATLSELKNPRRATFVKQQNNAVNQQINQDGLKQTENQKNSVDQTNKLLENIPDERLDFRASQTTSGVNQEMEAVGKIDRTQDRIRKRKSKPKCL